MIFFYTSSSNSPWYVPVGFIALSFFLQSGWLSTFPTSFFFGVPFSLSTWSYDASGESQSHSSEDVEPEVSGIAQLLCILVAVALSFFICKFLIQFRRQVGQDGIWPTLGRLRQTPWREWPTMWNAPERPAGNAENQRRGGGRNQSHQARFEQVSKRVQQLPTQIFVSKEDLERLPLHDLKVKLKEMGLKFRRGEGIDRCEAIKLALENGGSSSVSCGICCEDYESGDVLRRLPKCGHKFHLECVDRWLLTTTDYSQRVASCPICNCEL